MSIDGPGLLESDLAHDVYNQVMDLWDAEVPFDEICLRLATYEETAHEPIDAEIFLATRIKAFWEIGQLPAPLRLELLAMVESGQSLRQWADTGDAALARKRRAVLDRLITQTGVPKATPRGRRKYPSISKKLYALGDCLELVAGERTFRGVICKVLERRGRCDYAMLVMAPKTRSTRQSFEAGEFYGHFIGTPSGSVVGPHVIRLEHRMLLREGNPFTIVARVELDAAKFMLGSFGGVLDMGHVIADFERTQMKNSPLLWAQLHPLRVLMRDAAE